MRERERKKERKREILNREREADRQREEERERESTEVFLITDTGATEIFNTFILHKFNNESNMLKEGDERILAALSE